MNEHLEQQIKLTIQMNTEWNKGKPKHQQRTTKAKKLRRIGREILQKIDKEQIKITTTEQHLK